MVCVRDLSPARGGGPGRGGSRGERGGGKGEGRRGWEGASAQDSGAPLPQTAQIHWRRRNFTAGSWGSFMGSQPTMVVWRGEEEPRTASAGAVANLGPYTTKGYLKGTPLWDLFFGSFRWSGLRNPKQGLRRLNKPL